MTAQVAYSNINDIWKFPSIYYKESFMSDDGSVTVDLIMMDSTSYTGSNEGDTYSSTVADPDQQAFIENALAESTANYTIVASHYPTYSICAHGNTLTLIDNLAPLLEKYQAIFWSGKLFALMHSSVSSC